jgi:phosphoribosylglycinamide formyltransferase-1
MPDKGRVGILISGRGSNMVALVDAMAQGRVPAEPVLVLSNVPDAPGLELAAARGVPTEVVSHKAIKPREAHERRVIELLQDYRVDLVCLAGYMRLLTPVMVSAFRHRIFNIHPSLLPSFPGLHVQRKALEYGVKFSGCTVHYVDEECDHGPIVLQAVVPILDDDTEESLSARILEQEHRIYPEAVTLYFEGRLSIKDRRVRIAPVGVRP